MQGHVTPCSGDRDIEPIGVSDEAHLPPIITANERHDDDVAFFPLVIVDWAIRVGMHRDEGRQVSFTLQEQEDVIPKPIQYGFVAHVLRVLGTPYSPVLEASVRLGTCQCLILP